MLTDRKLKRLLATAIFVAVFWFRFASIPLDWSAGVESIKWQALSDLIESTAEASIMVGSFYLLTWPPITIVAVIAVNIVLLATLLTILGVPVLIAGYIAIFTCLSVAYLLRAKLGQLIKEV